MRKVHSMTITLGSALACLLWPIALPQGVAINHPPPEGVTIEVAEDTQPNNKIYELDASDASGNVLIFSILSQDPKLPAFDIDNEDTLLVPSQGLDAETSTSFTLRFSVKAGSSVVNSGELKIMVTDVNDLDPKFNQSEYTAEAWKNDPKETSVATVAATDPDISNKTITYRIDGNQEAFTISKLGKITLENTDALATFKSPAPLQVLASDGERESSVTVKVTVHGGNTWDITWSTLPPITLSCHQITNCGCKSEIGGRYQYDPCTSNPCKNGATCISQRSEYTCTCFKGYLGNHCQTVDYCHDGPCKNGATCINNEYNYTCHCTPRYHTQNCTQLDYCHDGPCKNGATCENNEYNYTCHCAPGYHTQNCTQRRESMKTGNNGCAAESCVVGTFIFACMIVYSNYLTFSV